MIIPIKITPKFCEIINKNCFFSNLTHPVGDSHILQPTYNYSAMLDFFSFYLQNNSV